MNLNQISIYAIIFTIGYLIGYNQREIREGLDRLGALINVKNQSGIVRGREVVADKVVNDVSEVKTGGIAKPKTPKQVAIESANKFMRDI